MPADPIVTVNQLTAAIARERAEHARRVDRLVARRDLALLRANRNGVTYDALVAETGLSDGYVAQSIRRAKSIAPDRLAARPPHRPQDRGRRARRLHVA